MAPKKFTGIDHGLFVVRDLEYSRAIFERLGFAASPKGVHSSAFGTANYCFTLRNTYIELLGIVTPTPINRLWEAELSIREGLHTLALSTEDIENLVAEFRQEALPHNPVARLSRLFEDGGEEHEARFAVSPIDRTLSPAFPAFAFQHETRSLIFRREVQTHSNGALDIRSATVVADDPLALHDHYEALFGKGSVRTDGGDVLIAFLTSSIRITTRSGLARVFGETAISPESKLPLPAAIHIVVSDLARAASVIAEAGVTVKSSPSGFWVGAESACGTVIEFLAE